MRWLSKIIFLVAVNALGLWAAGKYINGFHLNGGLKELLSIAVILTVLNLVLRPILKLFFGPIIVITLGLGLIVVNAIILYVLDFLSVNLTIDTITALLYATLLTSAINFVFHLATRK